MSTLYNVYKYLMQIKNKEITFQNLINKGFKDISEKDAYLLRDSLKSIVNRYYFLVWEQNKILPIEDENVKDYFICALGQYHYVKEISEQKLVEFFREDAQYFSDDFSIVKMSEALSKLGGSPIEISEKENEIIVKRLAINYAYPEWIVKMMTKHFGIKHSYKAIASSRKNIKITLNCNTFLTTAEKIIANNSSFEKGVLTTNSLHYSAKDKIIDFPEFKKNLIFVEDETSQLLVEKLNLSTGDEVLLIADDKGGIALDIAMHIKDVGAVHVAAKDIFNYNFTKNIAQRFKFHSFDVFESNLDLLLTHVGEKTCDKVLVIPNSSGLGLVRRKPAILLTLKRDDLDEIIENEKKHLEESAKYVKQGGSILYAVFTYNRKESVLIVEEFLNNHSDFELVEERQIYSYEAPSDGAYYAVLKRK